LEFFGFFDDFSGDEIGCGHKIKEFGAPGP
jgi:hypothetical protein